MKNYLRYKLQINIILLLLTLSSTIGISLAVINPTKVDVDKTSLEESTKTIDDDISPEKIASIRVEIDNITFEEPIEEEPIITIVPTTVVIKNNSNPTKQPTTIVNKPASTGTSVPTKVSTPVPTKISTPTPAKIVTPKPKPVPKPTTAAS
ncbi:hypothetical protein KBD45_02505 [Candidatus Dojkabacteria bacterium]|nr:hypothetical protein [Candidatus Dojkabacteria bacterium]